MKFTFAAAVALAIAATSASAQDVVQDRITSLFSDGFTHFSVSRGSRRTEIEGYSSDGREITVIIDSVTGEILSEQVELSDDGRARDRIRSIERTHAEDNDDDRESSGSQSFDDDGEGDDDRYERRSSRSDRERDERDDDRYEGTRSLSSGSDDSYERDDRDDDRYERDDRDDDRYERDHDERDDRDERDHDDHDERDDHDDD